MAKIQIKRGLSTNITAVILAEGELAFCIDTGKVYIGDGERNILVNPDAESLPELIPVEKVMGLGTAALKDAGVSAGNLVEVGVDGKVSPSVIPATAITDTFVVDNETAMLALSAQVGDICVRTDISKTYILKTAPAASVSNWQELLGRICTAAELGLGNVTNESKATMFASPAFTGKPTAPTPAAASNDTQVATTAFVKAQGYYTAASTIDGGSF